MAIILPCCEEIKYAVNIRTQNIEIDRLEAFTKDKVEIQVNGYCSVRVFDPEKAVFEVANCIEAIRVFAQSSVRTACGKLDLQEILDNRAMISAKVQEDMKECLVDWGFAINKFEINDLNPRDHKVKVALNNQITAEQTAKEKRINAESYFLSTKNKTDAEFFSMTKEADGY